MSLKRSTAYRTGRISSLCHDCFIGERTFRCDLNDLCFAGRQNVIHPLDPRLWWRLLSLPPTSIGIRKTRCQVTRTTCRIIPIMKVEQGRLRRASRATGSAIRVSETSRAMNYYTHRTRHAHTATATSWRRRGACVLNSGSQALLCMLVAAVCTARLFAQCIGLASCLSNRNTWKSWLTSLYPFPCSIQREHR